MPIIERVDNKDRQLLAFGRRCRPGLCCQKQISASHGARVGSVKARASTENQNRATPFFKSADLGICKEQLNLKHRGAGSISLTPLVTVQPRAMTSESSAPLCAAALMPILPKYGEDTALGQAVAEDIAAVKRHDTQRQCPSNWPGESPLETLESLSVGVVDEGHYDAICEVTCKRRSVA
jgi:hypothetical protein